MTARQAIDVAAAAGVHITVEGGNLVLEADGNIPDAVVAGLKQHKPEILALLRPGPKIRKEPPFGSDSIPPRYKGSWQSFLAQCPEGADPWLWQAAIYDAAILFGDYGLLIERYCWPPSNLFELPGGLAWFIRGSPVVAIGAGMAQTRDGRIWKRPSR